MRVALIQCNYLVGDIRGNTDKVISRLQALAKTSQPEVVIFPELTLTGYPPEDLLLKPEMRQRIEWALQCIIAHCPENMAALVGHPEYAAGVIFNSTSLLDANGVIGRSRKQALPNHSVFDEQRYFCAAEEATVVCYKGLRLGLLICEDLWHEAPVGRLQQLQPDLTLVINASPFHTGHPQLRQALCIERARRLQTPLMYLNWVGGQDELVFDGRSMGYSASGEIRTALPAYETGIAVVEVQGGEIHPLDTGEPGPEPEPPLGEEADLYRALMLGVRDYVQKNGFKQTLIGLSGGIDSALTLAIAADALGAENVRAVMMPFRYTSSMSIEDAQQQARVLGVAYDVIPIAPIYDAFIAQLAPLFGTQPVDTTEENLQARCRGVMLMALSNKFGSMVLTTGNKSEMAVGYATLYGDMAGGFGVLKDVFKTWVYRLARYRNSLGDEVIPQRVIDRPPSAELAPGQTDQDSLPPYDVLDAILQGYVEDDLGLDELVAQGFQADIVQHVMNLVDVNEHKRRQAPPGVRVTGRAFGRDRRYPVTSGYRYQPRSIEEICP